MADLMMVNRMPIVMDCFVFLNNQQGELQTHVKLQAQRRKQNELLSEDLRLLRKPHTSMIGWYRWSSE
jgi:hypothetical protein